MLIIDFCLNETKFCLNETRICFNETKFCLNETKFCFNETSLSCVGSNFVSNLKNNCNFIDMKRVFLLVGIISILASCTKDSDFDFNQKKKKFSVEEAKDNFETQAQTLNLAQFFNKGIKTKNYDENLFPEWKNAIYAKTKNGENELYMIPLNLSTSIKGKLNIKLGYYKTFFHKEQEVRSYLVVKREASGKIKRFVTTSIGSIDSKYKNDNPHLYSGSRKHFTGFFIISNEEGKVEKARFYTNGRMINLAYCDDNQAEQEGAHAHGKNERSKLFSVGFNLVTNSHSLTKGGGDGGYTTGEGEELCLHCHQIVYFNEVYIPEVGYIPVCSNCGLPPESLSTTFITLTQCSLCGQYPALCTCNDGGFDPYGDWDEGDGCPLCGRPDCSGDCEGSTGGNNGDGGSPSNNNWNAILNIILDLLDKQQYKFSCAFNAISYIYGLIGVTISEDSLITMFIEHLKSIGINSLTAEDLKNESTENKADTKLIFSFVSSLFETDYVSLVPKNFDQNHLFIGTILINLNIRHCIVIMNIADGGYYFYDPGEGKILFSPHHGVEVISYIRVKLR